MKSSEMVKEVYSGISTMYTRMSVSTMLQNIMKNTEFAIGASVAENPFTYSAYTAMDILDDLAGGIKLPSVHVMGNGINFESLVSIIKAGLGGLGVLSAFVQAITGMTSRYANNGDPLKYWNYRDTLVYGTGDFGTTAGSTKSETQIFGNTAQEDVTQGAVKQSTE